MFYGISCFVAVVFSVKVQDAIKGTEAQRVLGMHLTDERIEGFCKVSVCENVTESAVTIMHHAGIGSLQPNTVSERPCLLCVLPWLPFD